MNEVQKHIDTAYKLLSSIPVKGDAVDAAAACRMALRNAYGLAGDAGGDKPSPYTDGMDAGKEGDVA